MNYQIDRCENHPDAPWLILSSGLGGRGHFWEPQINALRPYFHLISYDHLGSTEHAEPLAQDHALQDLAQQVLALLKAEKISAFHFIGHALGGHIGMELAPLLQAESLHMHSLTMINAWDELDPHTEKCFQARLHLLKDSGVEAYVRAQALFLYPPAWISQHAMHIEQMENAQLCQFPCKDNVLIRVNALKKFRLNAQHVDALAQTRIHLIANQDDFLVPVQKSYDLKQRLPQAQLTVLPYGAHACTLTDTETVNQHLIEFLQAS